MNYIEKMKGIAMKIYPVKVFPEVFRLVAQGAMKVMLLKDKAGYKRGDMLKLVEFDPDSKSETGCSYVIKIVEIWKCFPNLPEGHCVIEIKGYVCNTCEIVKTCSAAFIRRGACME